MEKTWQKVIINVPERDLSVHLEVSGSIVMIDTNGLITTSMLDVFTTIIERMRNEYYHYYDDPFDWFLDKGKIFQSDCCRKEREVFLSVNDLLALLKYANDF